MYLIFIKMYLFITFIKNLNVVLKKFPLPFLVCKEYLFAAP